MTTNVKQNNIKKLLCVDDEKNILESLNRSLRCLEYEIILAGSGLHGLDIIQKESIDLIITDMRMPAMDGVEFLSEVRKIHKNIPSILLTGFSDQESTIRAVNEGKISAYVTKPWENNDLRDKVKSLLRISHLEKEQKRLLILTHNQNKALRELNTNLEEKVDAKVRELQDAEGMLDAAYDELSSSYDSVVKLLSKVICANEYMISKDYTELPLLAKSLAKQAGLSDYFIKQTYYAAQLFEVGKLSLPERLLLKPARLLSIPNFKELMNYPEIGSSVLENISNFHDTAQIIKHHYEYTDGSGAPYGLKGNDIPIGSRVLSIVKDYYLLQSGRFNGVEHTSKNAMKFLEKHKGKLYDEELVKLFATLTKQYELENDIATEHMLTSRQLQVGMKLSRDCTNGKGLLILNKGNELTEDTIERLFAFEKVYDFPLQFYVHVNS